MLLEGQMRFLCENVNYEMLGTLLMTHWKTREDIYANLEKLMVIYQCKAVTKCICRKKISLEVWVGSLPSFTSL